MDSGRTTTGVARSLLLAFLAGVGLAHATPTQSNFTQIKSFAVPGPPSGLFFDAEDSRLLYILSAEAIEDHGDPTLYAFSPSGKLKCSIRVYHNDLPLASPDGFFIDTASESAYFVDSRGPQEEEDADVSWGGSLYEVKWTNPCACSGGRCDQKDITWFPRLRNQWTLNVENVSDTEGGGVDQFFRNSGVVVLNATSWFGANGVDSGVVAGDPTSYYPKSVVQVDMTSSTPSVTRSWPFDKATVGHDVDMEALSCGPDECANSLFVGDGSNYIYELDLDSGAVSREWDLNPIVGAVDIGIGALTYSTINGNFYAGIRNSSTIHVVRLEGATKDGSGTLRSFVGLATTMGTAVLVAIAVTVVC